MNPYALSLGLGASLGLWLMTVDLPARSARALLRVGLAVQVGALLGARIAYVLLHRAAYQADWLAAFRLWEGGLALAGALPGGVAALLLMNQLLPLAGAGRVERLAWYGDRLVRMILPLCVLGMLGGGAAGDVYGPVVAWGLPAIDETGLLQTRLPLPPLAAALLLLTGFWVERRPEKGFANGWKACLGGLGICTVLLGVELLRAGPDLRWLGLRPGAWMALAGLFLSLGGLILLFRAQRGVELG